MADLAIYILLLQFNPAYLLTTGNRGAYCEPYLYQTINQAPTKLWVLFADWVASDGYCSLASTHFTKC